MMKLLVFLLVAVILPSSILSTPVDQCSDGSPLPDFVDVIGCESQPCAFEQGSDVVLYLNFTAREDLYAIQARIVARVIINIPYPLPEPDACKTLTNTHCPLEINEPAQYKLVMPILDEYPKISLRLTFSLLPNGKQEPFACFAIQAQVIGKTKTINHPLLDQVLSNKDKLSR